MLGVLADGAYFGDHVLLDGDATWEYTARAVTACTLLTLRRSDVLNLAARADSLRDHLAGLLAIPHQRTNRYGEAEIDLSAGHVGEPSSRTPSSTTSRRRVNTN